MNFATINEIVKRGNEALEASKVDVQCFLSGTIRIRLIWKRMFEQNLEGSGARGELRGEHFWKKEMSVVGIF